MSDAPINYEAVLADIDARIAKLQATREGIVDLMVISTLVQIRILICERKEAEHLLA